MERHFWRADHSLPSGDEAGEQLEHTCGALAHFYADITHKKPTHNTMKKGVNTHEPQSPFGKFVVAFFGYLDPNISSNALITPLRKVIAARNRR